MPEDNMMTDPVEQLREGMRNAEALIRDYELEINRLNAELDECKPAIGERPVDRIALALAVAPSEPGWQAAYDMAAEFLAEGARRNADGTRKDGAE